MCCFFTRVTRSAIEDLCIVESDPCEPLTCKELPAWQSIIDRDQLKVWRRPMEEDSGLYEYKGLLMCVVQVIAMYITYTYIMYLLQ